MKPLKLAIIAGEVSGDHLGADLVIAMKDELARTTGQELELVGVGGPSLIEQGLTPLFDYSELSIIGISAVLAKLPKLILRLRQTANAIIEAEPDILVIIDSPDFTHRVAKIVRQKQPAIPIINYVCPSVWAWKPERAAKMRTYIDHVLGVLSFEPEAVKKLGGPPLTYIGHRLVENEGAKAAREQQLNHQILDNKTILLLPGSRNSELKRMLEPLRQTATELLKLHPDIQFIMPTIARFEHRLKDEVRGWSSNCEVVVGEEAKWQAFAKADAALATSGTILLELALARIPCVSIYKTDFLAKFLIHKLIIWSAALPNIIVGYPAITEFYDNHIRPNALARQLTRLSNDTPQRSALLSALDEIHNKMQVERSPSGLAASIVLDHIKKAP